MKNFIRTLALSAIFIFGLNSFTSAPPLNVECTHVATEIVNNYIMSNDGMINNATYGAMWTYIYNLCNS